MSPCVPHQDHTVTHSQSRCYSHICWSKTHSSQDFSWFAAASVSARNSHMSGTISQAKIILNIIIISLVGLNLSNMKHSHKSKNNRYYLHPFHPHFDLLRVRSVQQQNIITLQSEIFRSLKHVTVVFFSILLIEFMLKPLERGMT